MSPEATIRELHTFVIESAQAEVPARRARLLRALARISGSNADAKRLLRLAAQCEELEAHHRQLVLDFKRGNGGRG